MGAEDQIQLWDTTLTEKAEKLWALRKSFVDKFIQCLNTTSKKYNDGELLIGLTKEHMRTQRKKNFY